MFEDLAIEYVNKSEGELRLISYGLVILGAIIAAVVSRTKGELKRTLLR